MYHTVDPFKVYDSVLFDIFTEYAPPSPQSISQRLEVMRILTDA